MLTFDRASHLASVKTGIAIESIIAIFDIVGPILARCFASQKAGDQRIEGSSDPQAYVLAHQLDNDKFDDQIIEEVYPVMEHATIVRWRKEKRESRIRGSGSLARRSRPDEAEITELCVRYLQEIANGHKAAIVVAYQAALQS